MKKRKGRERRAKGRRREGYILVVVSCRSCREGRKLGKRRRLLRREKEHA